MAIQKHRVLGALSETWEAQPNFLAARQLVRRSSQSLPSLRGRKIARIFLVTQTLSCSLLPSFLPSSLPPFLSQQCIDVRDGLLPFPWPARTQWASCSHLKNQGLLQNLPLLTQLRLIPSSVPICRHPQNLNPISSSDYNLNPPQATRQSPLRDPKWRYESNKLVSDAAVLYRTIYFHLGFR